MESKEKDPDTLLSVAGVNAFHSTDGVETCLTPNGPQTLTLLKVRTYGDDYYLQLKVPPELELPLPASAQIYRQKETWQKGTDEWPRSYVIPRADLGQGELSRIQFLEVGNTEQEHYRRNSELAKFEAELARCTNFLERVPTSKSAKAREAAAETLPTYNPADYGDGEGYVPGSQSSVAGGRIVLVDEEDDSVIGEVGEGFKVSEGRITPGSDAPVEITLPADDNQAIRVEQPTPEEIHPAYKKSTIVSTAMRASRLLITTSDYVAGALQSQAENFAKKTQPVAKPVTFTPATHENIRRLHHYSNKAVGLSASTVGSISKVAQNFGANASRRKDGKARGYDKDGNAIDTYKPGLINKGAMAFNTVVDGVEQAGRSLLTSTTSSVSQVVEHRWGPEAGEVSRNLGGGFKNVGLVYIDVTGVSRRAILKSVAKGMVVGNVKGGGKVIVGGVEKDGNGGDTPVQSDSDSGKQPVSRQSSWVEKK